MRIQVSDPTDADPISEDGDVVFTGDGDTGCAVSLPVDSPISSRLMMSGLRTYTVSMTTGPGTTWVGTMQRWRIGGNRVYLDCVGHIDYAGNEV